MLDHFFPLLFPKDSKSLKIFDIQLWEVGAKRPLHGTSKVNKQTHRRTDRRTFRLRLIESIGPKGWCFENERHLQNKNLMLSKVCGVSIQQRQWPGMLALCAQILTWVSLSWEKSPDGLKLALFLKVQKCCQIAFFFQDTVAQGKIWAHSANMPGHCLSQLFKSFFPITDIATYRLNLPWGQFIWNV